MSTFIDTSTLIHSRLINYWKNEHESYRQSRHFMQSRFDRAAKGLGEGQKCSGDLILERLTDLFLNGFGVVWSPVQVTIFHALVDSILPRIYLNEWEDVKTRVMNQRGLDRLHQETLVNMGRRNGKTWVVSGGCAAIFLTVPAITMAVFSVGKRQAEMFMSAAVEKIDLAFSRGTHVRKQDYNFIRNSQEVLVIEHPMGGKNVLGCYPGSSKVSRICPNPPIFDTLSDSISD